MIIKFEKLPDDSHIRVVDPTWRGDSTDLVVHNELTSMYTNPKLGLHDICELLLMYVGPDYPEHFYLRKYVKE